MYITVTPVAKPRMTRSDKWNQRPAVMKYRAFKDSIRENLSIYFEGKQVRHWIVFVVEMPQSWSKKHRAEMDGTPHQQKPDVDNFIKAFLDAVTDDDSHVFEVHALKIWGVKPGIYLGEEDYVRMSQTIQIPQKGPDAEQQPSEVPNQSLRGIRTQGGLRMRGLLPGARRR